MQNSAVVPIISTNSNLVLQ